jgi:hypothetical protein
MTSQCSAFGDVLSRAHNRVLRTAAEIAFRVRQEVANIRLWTRPPAVSFESGWSPKFPAPDARVVASDLAGSEFAREVIHLAREIRTHRFPIFGGVIDTGPDIRWRRDYRSQCETGLGYFRFIPYLDAARAGDHKFIWELNRHQHLVTLAQAFRFTGDATFLVEIRAQLTSWFEQNPFARGINWASALEVAFRALSWIWVDHLVGEELPPEFRAKLFTQLYRHGLFLENNLSIYFSPNTHLLGEALALHALGLFFGHKQWEQLGARTMQEQMQRQVHDDGSHVEQSAYYHLYALDMFLLHAILANPGPAYLAKLERMADYLDALLGAPRQLPSLGDDDGGRLFHPFGPRSQFGRATLATAAVFFDREQWIAGHGDLDSQARWWIGDRAVPPGGGAYSSRLFPDAGLAVMCSGASQVIVTAGSFGPWSAGHAHSGVLSILARSGDLEILIDPGTHTYTADPRWRHWFRSTEAHNTVRIDGRDQAVPAGPFRWKNPPAVEILSWETDADCDILDAQCSYRGFTHRRRVEFRKPDLILVTDQIAGPPGAHDVEQLWHLGSREVRSRLTVTGDAELTNSWRSATFGEKHVAPMLRVYRRTQLPLLMEARIDLSP